MVEEDYHYNINKLHSFNVVHRPHLRLLFVIGRFNSVKMETYKWHTAEAHPNNEETMNDYLENHLPQCFDVIFEDGTYVEILNKNTKQIFGVHASGDGDFTNHKVEFEFIR